jgi:hypothetical protein
MSANALGPVSGHQTDNESAYHRHYYDKPAQMVADRADHIGLKSLIEENVREQSDKFEQRQSDDRTERTDTQGQYRYRQ